MPIGSKGGFINLTFEGLNSNKTFRQALDTSNYYTNDDAMYINIYRRGHGDAGLEMFGTFYNMEIPMGKTSTFYSFGGYNHKFSDAYAYP
ncbi:MAG: hypothetical protein IPP39_17445 [Chitinophagaceae bacterium]|nr:hypothetical protein [Chitinophagaceae bacterium]